eukprot:g1998.t1
MVACAYRYDGWRHRMCLRTLAALSCAVLCVAQCHNRCSGHGVCNRYGQCTCESTYVGADCSQRACPRDKAWVDYTTGVDTAHANAECSNMGTCDHKTGRCTCRVGFEGLACERMSCPSSLEVGKEVPAEGDYLGIPDCNGHGVCLSMREAAKFSDGISLFREGVSYTLWDADKVYGCACDAGYEGFDCSRRTCMYGDDPLTTGQQNEVQSVYCLCNGCSGTWTLVFRGEETSELATTATTADVKAALEALTNVREVTVAYDAGTAACGTTGTTMSVTFTRDTGDLPTMGVTSSLTGGTSQLEARSVQQLKCTCAGCGGSFSLSYDGQTTAAIAHDANAATIEAALEALTNIDTTLAVTSTDGKACDAAEQTHSITFVSTAGDVPTLTPISSLTGSSTPALAVTTADGTREHEVCSNRGLCQAGTGTCSCGIYVIAEVQTLTCTGEGGTFTLAFTHAGSTQTTSAINYNANAATVKSELESLSNLNEGVTVTFSSGTVACAAAPGIAMAITFHRFVGDAAPLVPNIASLTGSGTSDEVQTLTCIATSGTFTLTFQKATTSAINFDATAATVKSVLEALATITTVGVAFSTGTAACAASPGVGIAVTFTTPVGNQPPITADVTLLQGGAGTIGVAETTTGDKPSIVNIETKVGGNEFNYTASNGKSAAGEDNYRYWDCGHAAEAPTDCPFREIEDEVVKTKENYTCSGHGSCSGSPSFRCTCQDSWWGVDCSLRSCPTGRAWFDEATATNVAHAGGAECSNKGLCDHTTGLCACQSGWQGAACERLSCANGTGGVLAFGSAEALSAGASGAVAQTCNGNGRCLTMYELALATTSDGQQTSYTYGATNSSATWDAHMIQGCQCYGRSASGVAYYSGADAATGLSLSYDCSLAACPHGDNPATPTLEVQTATCIGTGGTFKLSFNRDGTAEETTALAFDATAATVKAALEALGSVREVAVTLSTGTAACAASPGVGIAITFTSELGDLPALTTDVASLTGAGAGVSVAETTKGREAGWFEVQTATCVANSGTFTLTFRSVTSAAIAWDATAATLTTALQAMDTIDEVAVTFSTGTAACAASPGVGIAITFKSELGDVPALTAGVASLQGGAGTISVVETTKGDKESVECSEHGVCDHTMGQCKCFKGYTSSNHDSQEGDYRDCGHINQNPNNNPVVVTN